MDVKIIGLGGIGSILSDNVSRFLNFTNFHNPKITLIDGDEYEEKNLSRQSFSMLDNKASSKCNELRTKYLNVTFDEFPHYINNDTISVISEGDIILLGVDNHKTRKLISDHCKNLSNVILISGGNELTDGNVQIFIRKDGKDITPSLTKYHPEIENYDDKSPDEMTCEELQNSEPQLLFTNMMVACFMCSALYNILYGTHCPPFDSSRSTEYFKISEVYFDIVKMTADAKIRS